MWTKHGGAQCCGRAAAGDFVRTSDLLQRPREARMSEGEDERVCGACMSEKCCFCYSMAAGEGTSEANHSGTKSNRDAVAIPVYEL